MCYFSKFKKTIEAIFFFFSYPTYLEDHQVSLRTVMSNVEVKKAFFDIYPHNDLSEDEFWLFIYHNY